MDLALSFESALNPVCQPVIGAVSGVITYLNPAAASVFGGELRGRAQDTVFPSEVLENPAESFACSVNVCGKCARVFVCRYDKLTLYYIEVDHENGGQMFLTRRMLSHLRNCVTGAKIAADRCFTRLEDGELPDEKLISILYHYNYRLMRMIIQLDSADKLQRSEMAFSPEPIDLVSLCSELAHTLMNLSKEKGINIVFSAEEPRLTALADASLIELMLLNLFSNSLKNTRPGNTIELSVKQAQNKIVISLDDDGCGVPQNELSGIFSLPSSGAEDRRPDEGIGLGMYISHEIIRLHNGVLLFESREGEGVHIRALFPIGDEEAKTFNAPQSSYRLRSISPILTGLADVLSSNCYGPRFED